MRCDGVWLPSPSTTVVLLLAGPALLPLLARRTRIAAWLIAAVTLTFFAAGYPNGPVVLSTVVAVIVCVVRGHRTTAWLVTGTVLAGTVLLRGPLSGHGWPWAQLLAVSTWAVVVLVLAEVVRARRERAVTVRQAALEARRRQAGDERLRIAQEVHDVVAHHMSLINVQAGVALHLADRRPEQLTPALEAIKAASKEALVELRSLVGLLRDETAPAPRAPTATLRGLGDLVERTRHAGLVVDAVTEGTERALPAAVDLAAFRIVQESITNVVRHAGAHRAEIRLGYAPGRLTVQVHDDGGGGQRTAHLVEGNGLRGMRERVGALGGTLSLGTSPLGGLLVSAVLPTAAPAEAGTAS